MGLRQTFGLFFKAFEEGIGCTRTEFGLSYWNSNVILGNFCTNIWFLADKFGGNKAVFVRIY